MDRKPVAPADGIAGRAAGVQAGAPGEIPLVALLRVGTWAHVTNPAPAHALLLVITAF